DRLGKETLDELLEHQTQETYAAIDIYKQRLSEINHRVVEIEERRSDDYRRQLQDLLDAKTRELASHDFSKPSSVNPPTDMDVKDPLLVEIQVLLELVATVQTNLKASQNAQEGSAQAVSAAERLLGKVRNFQEQFETFRNNSVSELEQIGIEFDKVVRFE